MPHAHADGRDLAVFDPNAGQALASLRGNFVFGQKIDEQLLEPAQIAMQILAAPAKIDNRIAHQLAGPVISRLTAAIDREKRIGKMRRAEQTRFVRRSPNRVNRFVFEQKHFVRP